MKIIKLDNSEIRILPQSFAAIVKADQVLREAGLDKFLTGADIIEALKKDPDILHKLAAVYYLNDANSLRRWPTVWKEWADKYAPLQMLPIIEAGISTTREGLKEETLKRAEILAVLREQKEREKLSN